MQDASTNKPTKNQTQKQINKMSIQSIALETLGNTSRASWVVTRLSGIEIRTIYKCGLMQAEYFQKVIDSADNDQQALDFIRKEISNC